MVAALTPADAAPHAPTSSSLLMSTNDSLIALLAWTGYLGKLQQAAALPCCGPLPLPSQSEARALVCSGQGALLLELVAQAMQERLEQYALPRFWHTLAGCERSVSAAMAAAAIAAEQGSAASATAPGVDAGLAFGFDEGLLLQVEGGGAREAMEAFELSLLTALQDLCSVVDEAANGLQQLASLITQHLSPATGLFASSTAAGAGAAALQQQQQPWHSWQQGQARPNDDAGLTNQAHGVSGSGSVAIERAQLRARLAGAAQQHRESVCALLMAGSTHGGISVSRVLQLYYSCKLSQLGAVLAPGAVQHSGGTDPALGEEQHGQGSAGAGVGGYSEELSLTPLPAATRRHFAPVAQDTPMSQSAPLSLRTPTLYGTGTAGAGGAGAGRGPGLSYGSGSGVHTPSPQPHAIAALTNGAAMGHTVAASTASVPPEGEGEGDEGLSCMGGASMMVVDSSGVDAHWQSGGLRGNDENTAPLYTPAGGAEAAAAATGSGRELGQRSGAHVSAAADLGASGAVGGGGMGGSSFPAAAGGGNFCVGGVAESALGEVWGRRVRWVAGCAVRLGLGPAGEEALNAAVSRHVETLIRHLASGVFDREVLPLACGAAGQVPLELLRLVVAGEEEQGVHAIGRLVDVAGLGVGVGVGVGVGGEPQVLREWRLRLSYYVYETLGCLRLAELFDMVVDYPDSLPAVKDLAACLSHTSLQARFVSEFSAVLRRRLLHAGASAASIIHQYAATIRTLTAIDPSGALLSAVSVPIRAYLRARPDALQCAVRMVVQDGGGANGESLLEELGASAAADSGMDVDVPVEDGDGAVLQAAMASATAGAPQAPRSTTATATGPASPSTFTADLRSSLGGLGLGTPAARHDAPVGHERLADVMAAASGGGGGAGAAGWRRGDLVTLLIGVFGSKELFVGEYRQLLGGQLLYRDDYDASRELRTLELLKMRFGEAVLHGADVMLKDLADSKRINTHVHKTLPPVSSPRPGTLTSPSTSPAIDTPLPPFLTSLIMSYLFWPIKGDDKDKAAGNSTDPCARMRLPREVSCALESYAARYHHLKTPRKLLWRPHLGVVELSVCAGGVDVTCKVSPPTATLLLQFAERPAMSAATLAAEVGIPLAVTRRKMLFWTHHGVIRESRGPPAHAAGCMNVPGTSSASTELWYHRPADLPPELHGAELSDQGAEEEAPPQLPSAADKLAADMAPFDNYIMGMLTNYVAGLPLDRLHNMMRVFVVSPKFDRPPEQLAAYLSLLMGQDRVTLDNGVYKRKLAPPPPPAAS